ncbi:hypothetical protein LAZ67_19000059 [Cordylochernes scorpioides]|uniref:Uncharacterized protein n=1 Tax=Cordylochernes scorpioides TaxID=51811 RepID=A0ABY6LGY4_9ARAC|nr:hypothetical protein LAZ67_19000059 [Cordylochernes scorpioides]
MYSVGRRTKRWPLCLFFNFLDVVAINSAVIYKAVKQDGGMARKDFIKQLALQLMRDALNMRNQAKNLSRDLQVLIQKHAGTSSLENAKIVDIAVIEIHWRHLRLFIRHDNNNIGRMIVAYNVSYYLGYLGSNIVSSDIALSEERRKLNDKTGQLCPSFPALINEISKNRYIAVAIFGFHKIISQKKATQCSPHPL